MSLDLNLGRLSLAYQYHLQFPYQYIQKYGLQIKHLDLSHNLITDYRFLTDLPYLDTLIIDHNNINTHVKFPLCPQVLTLWVNHNRIGNIVTFIHTIRDSFPNLKYFSMWNNPAAPSFFNGGSSYQYKDYRYYVISYIPTLIALDDKSIDIEERKEAFRIYGDYIIASVPITKNKEAIKYSKKKSIEKDEKSKDNQKCELDVELIPDIPVVNDHNEKKDSKLSIKESNTNYDNSPFIPDPPEVPPLKNISSLKLSIPIAKHEIDNDNITGDMNDISSNDISLDSPVLPALAALTLIPNQSSSFSNTQEQRPLTIADLILEQQTKVRKSVDSNEINDGISESSELTISDNSYHNTSAEIPELPHFENLKISSEQIDSRKETNFEKDNVLKELLTKRQQMTNHDEELTSSSDFSNSEDDAAPDYHNLHDLPSL